MYSTTLSEAVAALPVLGEEAREQLLNDAGMSELSRAFACLPDPRTRLGRRYPLPLLLTCLVAALRCNGHSTLAVEEWCVAQQALLRRAFGSLRHLTPSGALYRRLLPRLPVVHLEWALAGWVRATRPAADTEAVAVDGKTVRGAAAGADRQAPQVLAVLTHQTQETLVQGHIESGLHYVRDVTFGEDRSRLRTGHGPQVMAALRNLALTLIHRTGTRAIAAARRHFGYHPDLALALLLPLAPSG